MFNYPLQNPCYLEHVMKGCWVPKCRCCGVAGRAHGDVLGKAIAVDVATAAAVGQIFV
jgi:hypothetical protein